MGSVVGICKGDQHLTPFMSEQLEKGESVLRMNDNLRCAFIDYVVSGTWVRIIAENEGDSVSKTFKSSNGDCVWTRFGYKTSQGPSPRSSIRMLSSDSTCYSGRIIDVEREKTYIFEGDSGTSCTSSDLSPKPVEYARIQEPHPITQALQALAQPAINPSSISRFFRGSDLRAVVCALLYPVYLCSPEYRQFRSDFIRETGTETLPPSQSHPVTMNYRLRQWLLGLVQSYTATLLEQYLAEPGWKWTDEFTFALAKLPVAVSLARVQSSTQESKIIYVRTPEGISTALTRGSSPHLHVLFGSDCSPVGAAQVAKAVFSGKTYKRNIFCENGSCQLRALKPVFNSQGELVFTLGLESAPFAVPSEGQPDIVVAQHCQDFDDLLNLLVFVVQR